MRIAIFKVGGKITVHVAWMAEAMARWGHDVEVWLSECPVEEIDEDALYASGARVHLLDDRFQKDQLPAAVTGAPFDLIIGVEKYGLIWAERVARRQGADLWYYSLEIYLEDRSDRIGKALVPIRLRLGEIGALTRVNVILIQDRDRWEALEAANTVLAPGAAAAGPQARGEIHFLPVCSKGPKIRRPTTWLHDRLGLPHDRKIILYFGNIMAGRHIEALIAAASRLPDPYVLVLHGSPLWMTEDDLAEWLRRGANVYHSPGDVAERDLSALIASAWVGLAFYAQEDANRRLTGRSSEKIARYVQCGVPFIAIDNPNYRSVQAQFDICELVQAPGDLPEAIARIERRYPAMRAACHDAFDTLYEFDKASGFLPALLSGVEERRRREPSVSPSRLEGPEISLVVPTRDRSASLTRMLMSLVRQTLATERFEVIVVDNGSTDDTLAACEALRPVLPNMRVLRDPRPGLHVGRNRGMAEARGDILVFCDDDIIAERGWLEAYLAPFEDPAVVVAGGPALPHFEISPPPWLEQFITPVGDYGSRIGFLSLIDQGPDARETNVEYVYGCNFAVRRADIMAAGGFLPDGVPGEFLRYRGNGETGTFAEMMKVEGAKAVYAPDARVRHVVPAERLSTDYLRDRGFRQGISNAYASIRADESVSIGPLLHRGPPERAVWLQAFQEGQIYLISQTLADRILLAWILSASYCDAPDLRSLPRGSFDKRRN